MLHGELTLLRARAEADIEILHTELYDDVDTRVRADNRPWVRLPLGSASPYRVPVSAAGQAAQAARRTPPSPRSSSCPAGIWPA
ncbi:MAG TPA: hypothetical protein VF070_23930 [Streptosporangiaceae bacterium]